MAWADTKAMARILVGSIIRILLFIGAILMAAAVIWLAIRVFSGDVDLDPDFPPSITQNDENPTAGNNTPADNNGSGQTRSGSTGGQASSGNSTGSPSVPSSGSSQPATPSNPGSGPAIPGPTTPKPIIPILPLQSPPLLQPITDPVTDTVNPIINPLLGPVLQ